MKDLATPVPADWADRSPLHRQALENCRDRAASKPADCVCCGCHTDGVDLGIPDAALVDMIETAGCPAERRSLRRILAGRIRL